MNTPRPFPLSYPALQLLETVIGIVASGGFALFGIASNITNIVVFYRQGILSNSSMVNLTGLAVSDLFNCLFTVNYAILLGFMHYDVPFDDWQSTTHALSLVTAGRPLEMTMQVTCWITAFTTLERVICVALPFSVKSIITPKRSLVVIVTIFVGTFVLCIPMTFHFYLALDSHSVTNKTYLAFKDASLPPVLLETYSYVNSVVLRFAAIFVVVLCNVILYWKVNLSQKFRKSTGVKIQTKPLSDSARDSDDSRENDTQVSYNKPNAQVNGNGTKTEIRPNQTKDMKLLRMITVVSLVFTFCYSIYIVYNILYWIVWEGNVDVTWTELDLAWKVSHFFQIVNSSTNIFIYYIMSSRYREEFDKLFCKNK